MLHNRSVFEGRVLRKGRLMASRLFWAAGRSLLFPCRLVARSCTVLREKTSRIAHRYFSYYAVDPKVAFANKLRRNSIQKSDCDEIIRFLQRENNDKKANFAWYEKSLAQLDRVEDNSDTVLYRFIWEDVIDFDDVFSSCLQSQVKGLPEFPCIISHKAADSECEDSRCVADTTEVSYVQG